MSKNLDYRKIEELFSNCYLQNKPNKKCKYLQWNYKIEPCETNQYLNIDRE